MKSHACSAISLALLSCLTAHGFAADIPAYKNSALSVEQRVDDLLPRMTLQEKVRQLTSVVFYQFQSNSVDGKFAELQTYARDGMGMFCMPDNWAKTPRDFAAVNNRIHRLFLDQSRLGIPILIHEEGLHGLTAPGATSFPMPMALASTWNPALVRHAFDIAGREAALVGANTVFAPVVDLAREQRWGRCEETYSEDPWLAGQIGKAVVTGFQGDSAPFLDDRHVAATLKHFVGHGSPEGGLNLGPTREDACTIEDIIALPFKICVQHGRAMNVMASYTELNGVPMHASKPWLTGVLRDEWGFNGLVVSDWSGINTIAERHLVARDNAEGSRLALRAGVDLETPEPKCNPTLVASVTNGLISESLVDRSVRRVLTQKFQMGLFDRPYVDPELAAKTLGNDEARQAARELAGEGMVLLKNENNLLPLNSAKLKTLAVVGPHAEYCEIGNYSGTPAHKISVAEGLRAKLGDRVKVVTADGVRLLKPNADGKDDLVVLEDDAENLKRIAEAKAVVKDADVIVLCIGGNAPMSREAWADNHRGDNASLELRAQQNELVRQMLATGKPVIVLLFHGAPLAYEYISQNVPALFECWYLGQETGGAVADVLVGDVNPSGKLPITVARSSDQLPVYYNHKPSARVRDYVLDNGKPLYPFGFGLSYTKFEYGKPALVKLTGHADVLAEVSVLVTNTGKVVGQEIVQLYVHQKVASLTRPVKELRDFAKIKLLPGETKTVTFAITADKLAYHNLDHQYVVEAADFDLMTGPDSEHLQTVTLNIPETISVP